MSEVAVSGQKRKHWMPTLGLLKKPLQYHANKGLRKCAHRHVETIETKKVCFVRCRDCDAALPVRYQKEPESTRVTVCSHPELKTFTFSDGTTIQFCKHCDAFDVQRRKALGEVVLHPAVSCDCDSVWKCVHLADLTTRGAQHVVAYAVKSACWMTLSAQAMRERIVPEDIRSQVWIKLLDGTIVLADARCGTLCRAAFKEARHLCTTYIRTDGKMMPVSRMVLPQIGGEDESGQLDDEGEVFLPWDRETHTVAVNVDDTMVASLNEHFTKDMMSFLDRDERLFLARYLRKRTTHSDVQRRRFERLVKRLRYAAMQIESQFI
jgi:hypothetical protein